MTFDVEALLARYDPAQWVRTLAYRGKSDLPCDPSALPIAAPILLDTTVYIDAHAGRLPPAVAELIVSQPIVHAAPSVAELALPVGYLTPSDPRTRATQAPILRTLRRIPPQRILVPTAQHWLEGALIAGILARTQGVSKEDRRKLVNDVLIYLVAAEAGATVVTRNWSDFDLLLQIKPGVGVLLYDRA